MRVGLIGYNTNSFVNCLINIWNAGNSAVIIDRRIPIDVSTKMLLESNVNYCYISERIRIDSSKLKFIHYFEDDKLILEKSVYKKFVYNCSLDEAVVLFSSGTTGESKGVILSHYAINLNAKMIESYMGLSCKNNILIVKDLCHSSSLVGELLVGLRSQAQIFLLNNFTSASAIINSIINNKIHFTFLNPCLLKMMLETKNVFNINFSNLRAIYVSGDILSENVAKKAAAILPNIHICNAYGLTEAGPRVSVQLSHDKDFLCSVGKPLNEVEIMLSNCDEHGNGSILVKTPCICSGYINKKLSTNEGWIDTHDIGYIKDGHLFVIGRKDNCIIHNAHCIFPETTENLIVESSNSITDCIVDIDEHGMLCCYYNSNKDVLDNSELRNLRQRCLEKSAPYEVPTKFIHVEGLYNLNGKKNRKKYKFGGKQ